MNPSPLGGVRNQETNERTQYKAQRISKKCCETLRRRGPGQDLLILDMSDGFIVVEPAGKNLGDGPVLDPGECDYELSPAWYYGQKSRLVEARRRLGLGAISPALV